MLRFLTCVVSALWLFLVMPLTALAAPATATLKVSPSSGTVAIDDTLTIDIRLDTGGQAAGGVGVDMSYSSNLEYLSASSSGSVFSFELTEPNPSNNHIFFERFDFGDGYNGADGQVMRFRFKVISQGTTTVTISKNASQVVAYEDSSDILQSVANGSYTFAAAPTPTPTSAPTTSGTTPTPTSTGTATPATPNPAAGILPGLRQLLTGASPSPSPSPSPVASPSSDALPKFYITDIGPLRAVLYRNLTILAVATRTAGILTAVMITTLSLVAILYSIQYGTAKRAIFKPLASNDGSNTS